MRSYLELVQTVLEEGVWQQNRTGIRTQSITGAMLKFDLKDGFPVVTTRRAPVKGAIGEMIGFLRGYTNAEDFKKVGCPFWTANANETPSWLASPHRRGENDLGQIYGHFWRHWMGDDGTEIDQVRLALDTLHQDPTSRRMVVSGWKAEAIAQGRGALPPCHVSWHLMANVQTRELSLCMWQRSCDLILGIGGGNIAGYAFLLAWIARLAGYTPRHLVMHLDDVHIYENHIEGALQQIARTPQSLPRLVFDEALPDYRRDGVFKPEWIDRIEPDQVWLENYAPLEPIQFTMAV